MKPASALLEPKSEALPKADSSPAFLVDVPAWHTIFLRNLHDLLRPELQTPLKTSSAPGAFWPDVFVTADLPWNRFGLSLAGHVTAIVLVLGLIQLWPQSPEVAVKPAFNKDEVVYYAPSEYLPPLDTGGARKPLPQKGEPEHAPQPIISVPPEADNRSQTIVTPSDIKLNRDVPLPNIVAWSQKNPNPAVPLASTTAAEANLRVPALPTAVVAPSPETMPTDRQRAPSMSQSVVAPAPDVNVESSLRAMQGPQSAIVAPAANVNAASTRRMGDINIGHSTVVAPAPELAVAEQYAVAGRAQAGGGNASPSVVPPAPSIAGGSGSGQSGRLIALGIHPAAVAPAEIPSRNRRGTFAATPGGKAGAAGTPDISANNSSGKNAGSRSGRSSGVPTGLSVGAAPSAQTSAVAGQGQGNKADSSRTVADSTPPRVSSTTGPPASQVSDDKATDVDHWIFGDRKFYALTLNMPNLNSAGGSWVIRFAELNQTGGKSADDSKQKESDNELSAPVATQKVDPAYPLEMMRRNVHGTVTLYAIIRNDGSVTDVRVLRGVDDRLDEYAREALAHWRFRPATKNGNPVSIEAVVMIPFRPVRGKTGF
jgi:TonB family protein